MSQIQRLSDVLSPTSVAKGRTAADSLADRTEMNLVLRLIHDRKPIARSLNSPRVKQVHVAVIRTMPRAAPWPILHSIDQPGAYRVSFDVPRDSQKVMIGLNRNRFVSALIKRACAASCVHCVPSLGMSEREPVHELRKLLIGTRPHDQVPMIRHNRECQEAHVEALFGFGEDLDKHAIIFGVNKQAISPARSVEDVMRYASRSCASSSRHLGRCRRKTDAGPGYGKN